MPFTFSHPAYILPFKYLPAKYFSFTGLIIGSITPDFEYFFRMDIVSLYSHSLAGILYFDLPVVFLISLLFHIIIKRPLIINLSSFVASRFVDLADSDFLNYLKKNPVIFIISALAGITTHLFIDAFTHKSGFFVREFSVLNNSFNLFGLSVPWYRLLQHVTSISGLIILFLYILKLPEKFKKRKQRFTHIVLYWVLILILTGLLFLLKYIFGYQSSRIGYWTINLLSCGMISLTIVSLYWKMFRKTN